MVAFHFQQSAPAGWRCDQCREAQLEKKRRCGFLSQVERGPAHVVWAKGRIATEECPKSYITAQSMEWIERFAMRRRLGQSYPELVSVKEIEAFVVLDQEITTGRDDG